MAQNSILYKRKMIETEFDEMHCNPLLTENKIQEKNQIYKCMKLLLDEWRLYGSRRLVKDFQFSDLSRGMVFQKEIELLAEQELHYPVVCVTACKVQVELTTQNTSELSEKDFIMATKIEKLYV